MDIEKSKVQTFQSNMEELFERKEAAGQMASSSMYNTANQMVISPSPVPVTLAAESVMSPRPQKTAATTIPTSSSDPTLLAILAALEHLSGEVKGMGTRLRRWKWPCNGPPSETKTLCGPSYQHAAKTH
jgi:hypothetical protein